MSNIQYCLQILRSLISIFEDKITTNIYVYLYHLLKISLGQIPFQPNSYYAGSIPNKGYLPGLARLSIEIDRVSKCFRVSRDWMGPKNCHSLILSALTIWFGQIWHLGSLLYCYFPHGLDKCVISFTFLKTNLIKLKLRINFEFWTDFCTKSVICQFNFIIELTCDIFV